MIGACGSAVLTASGRPLLIIGAGAIAQLGERLHGMQEVWGSSPHGSIAHKIRRTLDLAYLSA